MYITYLCIATKLLLLLLINSICVMLVKVAHTLSFFRLHQRDFYFSFSQHSYVVYSQCSILVSYLLTYLTLVQLSGQC